MKTCFYDYYDVKEASMPTNVFVFFVDSDFLNM